MRPVWLLVLLVVLGGAAQPDLGPVSQAVDEVVGQVVVPVQDTLYNATGQNVTREDVRLLLDLNFTKGEVNLAGLLVGSGTAEVQLDAHLHVEMRVISSDRIRAAVQGEDAYNMSAENSTALSRVYLTAEMFRATLSAEVIASFQDEQAKALREYLETAMPELDILGLDVAWSNVTPTQTLRDLSLTEPPITVEIHATMLYLRTESVPSLVRAYLDAERQPKDPQKAYVERLKEENGKDLRSRDFFAAAAYTQLLNLSMQPGWSLQVTLHIPRGYSFTYFNENVERLDDRTVRFTADALEEDAPVQTVVLASITHKRAVALALFIATVAVGLLVALPGRFIYGRKRVPRLADDAVASKR